MINQESGRVMDLNPIINLFQSFDPDYLLSVLKATKDDLVRNTTEETDHLELQEQYSYLTLYIEAYEEALYQKKERRLING